MLVINTIKPSRTSDPFPPLHAYLVQRPYEISVMKMYSNLTKKRSMSLPGSRSTAYLRWQWFAR